MAVTNMRIMIRRDTEAMWLANGDNTLLEGEIGYELDSRKMKIGYQSKAYSELPYFAGGIVDIHPDGGLKLDEAGMLYFDNDMVLGELPANTNIKAYVDGLVQAEGSVRSQEDQLLSNRIDGVNTNLATETSNRQAADSTLQQQIVALQGSVSDDIGDIAEGTSVKEYVDTLVQQEASVRANLDSILTSSKASLSGADFTGVVTAPAGQNVIPFLFPDQAAFPPAASAHGAILHSHADAAMFFAHAGAYHQVLDANTGYTSDQVDDKFGTLSISGPTGGVFASDNVTDFVSDLLFRNATGDMGGLSMKEYVDFATSELSNAIKVIYDPSVSSGIVVDLGAQINALTDRVVALEQKFDSTTGDFNGNVTGDVTGNLTGNTTGIHIGDVQNGAGDTIVDAANANFNGNVTGNLTGDTVGSHYGNVYYDTNVLVIDGVTGAITGSTGAFSGALTALAGDGTADSRVITLADMQAYAPLVDPNFTGSVTAGGTITGSSFQAAAVGGGLAGDVYNNAGDTKIVDSEAAVFYGNALTATDAVSAQAAAATGPLADATIQAGDSDTNLRAVQATADALTDLNETIVIGDIAAAELAIQTINARLNAITGMLAAMSFA